MTEFNWQTVEVTLVDPFEISYGRTTTKTNVLVQIDDGLGCAAPSTTCHETTETVLAALPKLAACVGENPFDLAGFHQRAAGAVADNPAAKAAVDIALYDRAARRAGLPLYNYLGVPNPNGKESTISIGIDTPEGTLARMAKFPGTQVFKIKMGYPGDIERFRLIAAATDKRLRIDANGGWDPETALDNVRRLNELGVEVIEQPLPVEHHDYLARLREVSAAPILVDEGCRTAADVPRYAGLVDGVNVKLMKCGGVGPALEIIAVARALGLKLMLGCMLECAVSVTAAAHLAGMFDYLDLDSHLLLADDPYRGMIHEHGRIKLPDGIGTGVIKAGG
jgi:L-alanine-DL-glutamate epimerase-like enolase superfamily enzyme